MDIVIKKFNATYNLIETDASVDQDIYDYFTFKVPNYEFMRRKNPRLKHWSGDIHLYSKRTKKLYVGLTARLEEFARDRQLTVQYEAPTDVEFSAKEATDFIKTLNLPEDK